MKHVHLLLISALLATLAPPSVSASNTCVKAALGAWFLGGKSPYKTFSLCMSGDTRGDPHITTLGGITYDHNFPGLYTLLTAKDGSFTVLSRNVIDKTDQVSAFTVISALKFEWSGHSVEIHRGNPALVFVDGQAVKIHNGKKRKIGELGYVVRKGQSFFIANLQADVGVTATNYQGYLDVIATVPRTLDTVGLLGHSGAPDLSDNASNPLSVLPHPSDASLGLVTRTDFTAFLDSWRIPDQGVFSAGEPAAEPDYGAHLYTTADLSAKQRSVATKTCNRLARKGGSTFNQDNCLFDLGFAGTAFLKSNRYHLPSTQRLQVVN